VHRRITMVDVLAYGLCTCFVVFGLITLAVGDGRVGPNRGVRTPVDLAGPDRTIFGFALLGAGYLLLRWLYRTPGLRRRWKVELQLVAAFAGAGYVACRLGAS
jgi:hypothetical protein